MLQYIIIIIIIMVIFKCYISGDLIVLYIVLAYLMLLAALSNAVCLYNASFFAIDFYKCFLFSCFVLVY